MTVTSHLYQFNITPEDGRPWFMYEAKRFTIEIQEDDESPLDITGKQLRWTVYRTIDGVTTIGLVMEMQGLDNIATWDISAIYDYDNLYAGHWLHELRSLTDGLILASGEAEILFALAAT